MSKQIITVSVAAVLTTLPSLKAKAAEDTNQITPTGIPNSSSTNYESGWRVMLDSSYNSPGTAKFQGTHLGKSDAFSVSLDVGKDVPLNDQWFLQFDLGQDNFFLGEVAGAPIPNAVHTMRFGTGVGYRLNDQLTLTGMVSPLLYRFEDIQGDDVGFSGGLMASYRENAKLTWSFGLMVMPDTDLPVVLPVVGVKWLINDRYTLEVGIPKTRLSYHFDQKLTLYTGLDLVGTTFRTSDDMGTRFGQPQYNNALATYRDIRMGIGASYKIIHGLQGEVEAGCSAFREINYTKVDSDVKFDPGAYVRLGLTWHF